MWTQNFTPQSDYLCNLSYLINLLWWVVLIRIPSKEFYTLALDRQTDRQTAIPTFSLINIGVVTPIIDLENMSIIHYRSMLFNSWMEKKKPRWREVSFQKNKEKKSKKGHWWLWKNKARVGLFPSQGQDQRYECSSFPCKKRSCAAQQPMRQVNLGLNRTGHMSV